MSLPKTIIQFLHNCKKRLLFPERIFYTQIITPLLVKRMRKKDKIRVLFVVFEVASWKTENLYNYMLKHPRFSPSIMVTPPKDNKGEIQRVEDYMRIKGYDYICLKAKERIYSVFHPDIIFYQKPYSWCIDSSYSFRNNLRSLFCYMSYCFRNTIKDFNQNSLFLNYAWQVYVENESVLNEMKAIMDNSGKNLLVTGLSVMDDLMLDKKYFLNPWNDKGNRKRIIYAPHHTICNEEVNRSTFLLFGEFMLEMAEKYKDQVYWAFKPHPLLRIKLNRIWGESKTDAYFKKWSHMDNSQFENGEYMGLFKYSDAMIHDSGSFMLEYLYTNNPVMYLDQQGNENLDDNCQTQKAYSVHYIGKEKEDIESFIVNVIRGKDELFEKRYQFYQTNLIPPKGKSVCGSVVDAILGNNN